MLIAQTDRFKAAVNISGKVDIISFLGDSPKIGTRNYNAAEKGQDRIGETLWQAPMKYIAHSAIFYADRIKTPLLMLTGKEDWNVPATNEREMYYALRRLGRRRCGWSTRAPVTARAAPATRTSSRITGHGSSTGSAGHFDKSSATTVPVGGTRDPERR